jgi:DNA modification methylase
LSLEIQDNSVGHINCDPPYNVGFQGEVWDSFPTEDDYLDWCREWITEYVRVLQPNRMM